jgi:hypothetical protein
LLWHVCENFTAMPLRILGESIGITNPGFMLSINFF